MLDLANKNQLNALSEMVLNVMKQNVPIQPKTIQANKREELKDKVDYWHRKYNQLYADYIALKYDDSCLTCQKVEDSTWSCKTYTLCESCAAG